MERTTDWKVPAALILAGLALLVALSGRGFSFPGEPRTQSITVSPDGGSFRLEKGVDPSAFGQKFAVPEPMMPSAKPGMPAAPVAPDVQAVPAVPAAPASPDNIMRDKMLRYSVSESNNPIEGAWQYVQGLIDYLSPLFQWVALGLLIWLGYRYLSQRNRPRAVSPAPPVTPAQPPPPANYGDMTQPESRQQE